MDGKKYNIAVVGATGAVGVKMIEILEGRNFPVENLFAFASEYSIGKKVFFHDREIPVEDLAAADFKKVDIALFSAGGEISLKYAPMAVKAGAIVIDNSSAFRMMSEVPLVVPEINALTIAEYKNTGIIANPNCSTIQLAMVLYPLHKRFGVKRVVISTYQSTSGAGTPAMEELKEQTVAVLSQKEIKTKIFPHRIAFNCIPHIDSFTEDGRTKEEAKLIFETKKILGDESIQVTATAVRVPIFYGHCESVNIEFKNPVSPDEARKILKATNGVEVQDDPASSEYPMAINVSGRDFVAVGRIRKDDTVPHGLDMWIAADNLRKGAALNAVQIAEILLRHLNS